VNEENETPTVADLPPSERAKALLPATGPLLALLTLVLLAGFAYSSNRTDEAQRKADRENRQLLALSTARFAYATNKSVCGFRKLAEQSIDAQHAVIKRSKQALADPTISPGARARNLKAKHVAEQAIRMSESFLDSQVTVPYTYDCRGLPTHPPPETRP
jgi:hypothetical protein